MSENNEIKEFHFHVYWFLNDDKTRAQAEFIRSEIVRLNKEQYFIAIPLITIKSSFEVWVPQEYFAKVYSWFLMNRPVNISVLVHPLTKEEILDHTERAVFLGPSVPLKLDALHSLLPKVPAQYPELELGYSNQSI